MKDDFLLRQIIVYGTGVILICAWAILRIIPYAVAMYLSTAILSYSMFIEAKKHKEDGHKKKATKKFVMGIVLVVCMLSILILNP